MIQSTPKIGVYRNALYYFQQNYINWRYYADSRLWDAIAIDDMPFVSEGKTFTSASYQSQGVLSIATTQYFTESYFKINLSEIVVTISSAHPQTSELIRYTTYTQDGSVYENSNASILVDNTGSKTVRFEIPIGELSDTVRLYGIDFYIKNRNVAFTIIDQKTFQKSYTFVDTVTIPDYIYSNQGKSYSASLLSTKSDVTRVPITYDTATISAFSYQNLGKSYLFSSCTGYIAVSRVPITYDTVTISTFSYLNLGKSYTSSYLTAYTVKTY